MHELWEWVQAVQGLIGVVRGNRPDEDAATTSQLPVMSVDGVSVMSVLSAATIDDDAPDPVPSPWRKDGAYDAFERLVAIHRPDKHAAKT